MQKPLNVSSYLKKNTHTNYCDFTAVHIIQILDCGRKNIFKLCVLVQYTTKTQHLSNCTYSFFKLFSAVNLSFCCLFLPLTLRSRQI